MKTNLEQNIKSQLDERKLTPLESSWDKLSQMMDEEKPQAKTMRFPKWWTLAIAASVVICISIFVVNPFEQTTETSVQIADTKEIPSEVSTEKNEIISEEIQPENVQIKEQLNSNETQTQMVQSDFKSEKRIEPKQKIEIAPVQNELNPQKNLIPQELKLPEPKKQEEIAVNLEPETQSKPEPKKKTNYTNPDMLLYSVENNQAISEKNKDNSRLVIIDFNK